jgi:GntR family transcriptional regulator/MocR family aminotransferase
LALHPLSPWYIEAKPRQGLLLGFANVLDEADARRVAGILKQALPSPSVKLPASGEAKPR